jgi:hypothetical protein
MRSSFKKFLLLVAVLSVAVVIGIHLLIYRSAAANSAREALLRDTLISDACGKNLQISPWFLGRHFVSYSGEDRGTALLHFQCTGSKATVRVTVDLLKAGDTWRVRQIAIDP